MNNNELNLKRRLLSLTHKNLLTVLLLNNMIRSTRLFIALGSDKKYDLITHQYDGSKLFNILQDFKRKVNQ